MCTDAYREALTRDLSSRASSAPGQRHATEAGREGAAAADAGAGSGPAMALADEATVVNP
jgi:hypothetical protein